MINISEQELTPSQKDYFFSILKLVNRSMAVHEGDANRRLASESANIIRIDQNIIPSQDKKEFEKLIEIIKKTLAGITFSDREPYRIDGIRNTTAVKYIKLLWQIEDTIQGIES
jgi:hypothetical protein